MIKSFSHKGLEDFFYEGSKKGIQPKHTEKLADILDQLDAAATAEDISYPGSNLHPLHPKKDARWAVKVSGNWRVTFRFREGDAYDTDYEGTLYSVNSTNITYIYQYDDRRRKIREIQVLAGHWLDTGYTYDSMDNIIKKHIPSGEEVSYSYNLMGKLEKIQGYLEFTYNAFGAKSNKSYANGLDTIFSYDDILGRLEQIEIEE